MKKIYLAGPDVFLPNAKEVLAQKKALCAKYGLQGLSPMDTELNDKDTAEPTLETARAIFEYDVQLMNEADAVLANMEPFRGPSMDTGTAFEMGYMAALKKPIFGYSENEATYSEKYETLLETITTPFRTPIRDKFAIVEDFGLIDNLMMVESVRIQGIEIATNFEAALRLAAEKLGA